MSYTFTIIPEISFQRQGVTIIIIMIKVHLCNYYYYHNLQNVYLYCGLSPLSLKSTKY